MNRSQLQAAVKAGKAQPFSEWVSNYSPRLVELLKTRNNLSRDDLEYLAETASKLKDERMKSCIATLIGWGDDERSELETFIAIAVEVMKKTPPSRLREAASLVALRAWI